MSCRYGACDGGTCVLCRLDVALARAEKAERERDEARNAMQVMGEEQTEVVSDLRVKLQAAEAERDEAWTRFGELWDAYLDAIDELAALREVAEKARECLADHDADASGGFTVESISALREALSASGMEPRP